MGSPPWASLPLRTVSKASWSKGSHGGSSIRAPLFWSCRTHSLQGAL